MARSKNWLKTNIALVGSWEPLAILRRWGRGGVACEREYESAHTEKVIRKIAESGFNLFITHYHKGFGWETEREEREKVKKQVELCHKHKIKIGVYFRIDNIIGETFFQEIPESRNWVARNEHGEIPKVCNSYWRHRICFNEPGYREYAKKVIKYAVEKLDADLIHFDGFNDKDETWTCKCERCQKGFTEFLVKKWGNRRKEATLYFGHDKVEGIEIPRWKEGASIAKLDIINFPEIQEWIRYKCFRFFDFHRELADYIHSLNPNVVMSINSGVQSWINSSAYFGIYLPMIAQRNDIILIEDAHFPAIRENDILCHRIRDYKIANQLGQYAITYCHYHNTAYFYRSVAESMAFNNGHLGHLAHFGDALKIIRDQERSKHLRNILTWSRKHSNVYRDSKTNSEVAILRNFSSMAFDCRVTQRHVMLMEQLMIQKQIPFDIIFDEHLDKRFSKYRLLILANQVCLSKEIIKKIAGYVKAGGSLVITGKTGENDENYQRYENNMLIKELKLKSKKQNTTEEGQDPSIMGWALSDTDFVSWPNHIVRFENVLKGGRVVYIPEVIPGVEKEIWFPDWRFDPQAKQFVIEGELSTPAFREYPFCNWALPKNKSQLLDGIKWAGDLSITIDAPEHVAVNWTKNSSGKKEYLHFVNYDNTNTLCGIKVFYCRKKYKRAVFFRLDPEPGEIPVDCKRRPGQISVPEFQTYGVLELSF